MANRTVKDAKTIHMGNPQYLIEKIIRSRIYESRYWKEECFGLNAEILVDKACELKCIGGVFGGNTKPTPFLCLVLKMLQIQPEMDIVIEFIKQPHFKYPRALGAFYMRITGSSLDVWKHLEPLLSDHRKMRRIDRMGLCTALHMDDFIDELLREDRVFDVILPRINKRRLHEDMGELEPRVNPLEDELDDMVADDDESAQEIEENEPPKVKAEKRKKGKHKKEQDNEFKKPTHEKEANNVDKYRDHGRDREKERERERERERSDRNYRRDYEDRWDRDRNRERERGDRYRDRDRDHNRDRDRSKKNKKDKRDRDEKKKSSDEKDEINNWNAIRAKLGLAPLK